MIIIIEPSLHICMPAQQPHSRTCTHMTARTHARTHARSLARARALALYLSLSLSLSHAYRHVRPKTGAIVCTAASTPLQAFAHALEFVLEERDTVGGLVLEPCHCARLLIHEREALHLLAPLLWLQEAVSLPRNILCCWHAMPPRPPRRVRRALQKFSKVSALIHLRESTLDN